MIKIIFLCIPWVKDGKLQTSSLMGKDSPLGSQRERSGSVVECLTQDLGGRRFEPHRRHCVVSLSKTH